MNSYFYSFISLNSQFYFIFKLNILCSLGILVNFDNISRYFSKDVYPTYVFVYNERFSKACNMPLGENSIQFCGFHILTFPHSLTFCLANPYISGIKYSLRLVVQCSLINLTLCLIYDIFNISYSA